jgi:hypothetical protein
MEYHARKCERCEEFGLNTTKLPLHYTRRESTIELEDAIGVTDVCLKWIAKCLMYSRRNDRNVDYKL